jgi:hypothetical protein
MAGVQREVVQGLNRFIEDQKDEAKFTGDATTFTLTVFDTSNVTSYLAEDIQDVKELRQSDTLLGGGTALLDAVGSTLTKIKQKNIKGKKLVVIYTDGEENASREYTSEQIEKMINKLQKKGDWTFVFMGSELEGWQAERAAAMLGIQRGNTVTTYGGAQGTTDAFAGMSVAASAHKRSAINATETFYADYANPVLASAIKETLENEDEGTESSTEL